jgi:hypothetical protein
LATAAIEWIILSVSESVRGGPAENDSDVTDNITISQHIRVCHLVKVVEENIVFNV